MSSSAQAVKAVKDLQNAASTLANPRASPQARASAAKALVVHQAKYGVPYMSKMIYPGLQTPNIRRGKKPQHNKLVGVAPGSGTTAPVSVGRVVRSHMGSVPGVSHLSHRELFTSLEHSSTSFEVRSWTPNPGRSDVFPWLHSVARSFDLYELSNVVVEYVPTCSTAEAGAVYICWDPDPADSAPSTKALLVNSAHSASSNVWQGFTFRIPNSKQLFMRHGATAPGDVKLYDHGRLSIATEGVAVGVTGDFYISYTVNLRRPQTDPLAEAAKLGITTLKKGTGTVSKNNILGSTSPQTIEAAGNDLINVPGITNTSNKTQIPIQNIPEASPSTWVVWLQYSYGGTGVGTCAATLNGVAPGATYSCSNGGSTLALYKARWTTTADPNGTVIEIDATGSTTVTVGTVEIGYHYDSAFILP